MNSCGGITLNGGGKGSVFYCQIEKFQDRWFVREVSKLSLDQAGEDPVLRFFLDHSHDLFVTDQPLNFPICQTCQLSCPGMNQCPQNMIVEVRNQIRASLQADKELKVDLLAKKKELKDKDLGEEEEASSLLTRSLKKRLKRGFVPYWNRPLDLWVWQEFYEELQRFFKVSFDSFGNTSIMASHRWHYILRHLAEESATTAPSSTSSAVTDGHGVNLWQSDTYLFLIQFFRRARIDLKKLLLLKDVNQGVIARIDIVRQLEKHEKIFLYENDFETVVKKPKAFEAFLLCVAGIQKSQGLFLKAPAWSKCEDSKFFIPDFLV